MYNKTFLALVMGYTTITTIPIILRFFIKKHYKKLAEALIIKQDTNSYYQCMFIDYRNFYCKPHLINRQECGENCSYNQLKKLLHYISSAKKSISLCMYMLTLKQVSSELVKLHYNRKGILIRFITDKTMAKTGPVQGNLNYFKKHGILYKISNSDDEMMHHKFCLIDENDEILAKMFFGSLNLTAQAFSQNFESVIFTNNKEIIKKHKEEFEELWNLF